jgi:hypothetical protein
MEQGEPSDNVAPFGCGSTQRYQQAYLADLFPRAALITSIAFFQGGQALLPSATYELRLSTTGRPLRGLSHALDANPGPDETVVFSRRIEGHRFYDELRFDLDTPFPYDPAAGHLLLEIRVSDPVPSGCQSYRAVANSPQTSRRPAYGNVGDGYGLVTRFGAEAR